MSKSNRSSAFPVSKTEHKLSAMEKDKKNPIWFIGAKHLLIS